MPVPASASCSRPAHPGSPSRVFGIAVAADMHVEGRGRAAQKVVVDRRDLQPVSIILVITGLISVSSSTRSPMTMAPPCIGLNATHPPSASAGLMVTPSSVTFRSVRGKP